MVPASRRRVLGMVGTAVVSGCLGLNGVTDESKRSPPPFVTEPSDWEHPGHDSAHTRAPPASAVPETIPAAPTWTARFTASTIDAITDPIVADGTVYVVVAGVDGPEKFERLVALDARTGTERWHVESTSTIASPPVVADGLVFWPSDGGHALNAADGSERWRHTESRYVSPLAAHGLVLTTGGTAEKPTLEALRPETGRPYWTRREGERRWDILAASEDAFYVTLHAETADQTAELHALDPDTGETAWATADVAPSDATIGPTHLFTSTGRPDAQRLLAIDLNGQRTDWSKTRDLQRTLAEETVNGQQSVGALTDESLLVHHSYHGYTDDRLEARDPTSGDRLWSYTPRGPGTTSFGLPVAAGNRVYLFETREREEGSTTSTLRVLDNHDGSDAAQIPLSYLSYGTPVLADEKLYHTRWHDHDEVSLAARFPQ